MAAFPPFVLPDFGGQAASLGDSLVNSMNARTQRMFAENTLRREEARDAAERAKIAREQAELELKHKQQAFSALPTIMRMARTSPEMANANPYGINVESQTEEPAPITSPLPVFQPHEAPPEAQNVDARGNWVPPDMPLRVPEVTPDAPQYAEAAPSEEPLPQMSDEATRAITPMRHTFATVNGQRFEVQPESQAPAQVGKDFGETYDYFLEQTNDPTKALGLAERVWANRQKAADATTAREDTQDFGREMNLDRTDKLSEAEKNRAARLAAKKKGGGGGLGPGNKAWEKEEAELAQELNKYEERHGIWGKGGLGGNIRELGVALTAAKKHPNGQEQLQILDKMIRAATGLGVRNQTLKVYVDHLGGLKSRLDTLLSQYKDGRIGDSQWNNVIETLNHNLTEVKAQQKSEATEFEHVTEGSDAYKRHPDLIGRRRQQMFGADQAPPKPGAGTGDPLIDKYQHLLGGSE